MGVVNGTPGLAASMARATASTPAATVPDVQENATTSIRPPGRSSAVARRRSSTMRDSVAIETVFSDATRLATTDTGWPASISANAGSLTRSVAGTTRPMRGRLGERDWGGGTLRAIIKPSPPLQHRAPAVHRQRDARDEVRILGRQEQHRPRDVLGRARTAQRADLLPRRDRRIDVVA